MQFIIFYFSGTGNTQLITQEVQNRLIHQGHSVETVCIEDTDRLDTVSLEDKIVGFSFPVYKFSYPDIFDQYFPVFNRLAMRNPCFIFTTYTRFADRAILDFASRLDPEKYQLIAHQNFKAPSCGIAGRKNESDEAYLQVMFFEDEIDKKINQFIGRIMFGLAHTRKSKLKKTNIFRPIKKKIVSNIEKTKYPIMTIDAKKCNLCGMCANNCPDQNLIKTDLKIEILDDKNCLHCLRCINHCPQNAILFGALTIGDNQYTIKKRDLLYKKAISGHKEAYWENFDEVMKKWRKDEVLQWLKIR